jgi:hypothetical protein
MEFPATLPLSTLQSEHPDYASAKHDLLKIQLLAESGHRLKRSLSLFLQQRCGEEPAVYQQRLKKFGYSNTLGAGIAQLASKLSNGQIHASQAADWWNTWRNNNDGQGRTEQELIEKLFAETATLGHCWAHVDKPVSAVEPRSRGEEVALGLEPRVVIYNALQVPNWAMAGRGVSWVKVYQVITENADPSRPPRQKAVWTFIDSEHITRFSAYVKLGAQGEIKQLLNAQGEEIDSSEEAPIAQETAIAHGFGLCPVTRVAVPGRLWAGDQAYSNAEQCLRLECHRFDLLTAAYLQRTYKPAATPDELMDLDNTYVDEDDKPLPTGLQYVIKVDEFKWNEPTGAIIGPLTKTLEETKRELRAILSLGGAYLQEGAVEASGESKRMDFVIEAERLEAYGAVIVDALNDLYQIVAKGAGQAPPSISGLNEFGGDAFGTFVAQLVAIASLDLAGLAARLPLPLFELLLRKLYGFLSAGLSPDERDQVLEAGLPQLPPQPPAQPRDPAIP